jgi:hypothetical protein
MRNKTSVLNEQVLARWVAYRNGPRVELVAYHQVSNFYAYTFFAPLSGAACFFNGVACSIGPYESDEEAIADVQARVDGGQFDPPPANWVRILSQGDKLQYVEPIEVEEDNDG